MSKIAAYREIGGSLPETYEAWELVGAGLENLGEDRHPSTLKLREPRANEILLRSDAIGLCPSDIKIIKQADKHPRLRGRDLELDPVVMGHECAVTVIAVGEKYRDQFKVGARYMVQADIYYKGVNYAFGYLIQGGMGQYCYADERMVEGDEGCYLLPLHDDIGYSQAALAEPWACVERSYNMVDRFEPALGRVLVVTDDDLPDTYEGSIHIPSNLDGLADDLYETIIVFHPEPEVVERLGRRLAHAGTMVLLGDPASDGKAAIDVGRIHYEGIRFYGGGDNHDAIAVANNRSDVLPNGAALFIGAGGPIGQMHVQRAVELPNGPKKVVVTDLDRSRMDHIERRFAHLAESRGVELITYARSDFESSEQLKQVVAEQAPGGYNDICFLAPHASLITAYVPMAADRALINCFAGIPAGTTADIAVEDLCRGVKLSGSSGSRIRDLRRVLKQIQAGKLHTNVSVAAIGGFCATWDGLDAVQYARFPGKIVIYPQIPDLPLLTLPELGERYPEVAERLGPDNTWNNDAERALMEACLK